MTRLVLELDLAGAGAHSIIRATGFAVGFSRLNVDAFDETGRRRHHCGISTELGINFLGLPWLSNRSSGFIWGVWHDAKRIADHIATQRKYLAYHRAAQRRADEDSTKRP